MAIAVAALIDRAKALADRRSDASVPDADWVTYVNWGVEDLYRLLVSLDPAVYFQSIDFTLAGGSAGSVFNLDLAFVVRLVATTLPAFTPSGGPGPGRTLTANANGALSVDSVAVAAGDRILYAAASASAGIYTVSQAGTAGTPFILVRATDFDAASPTEVQVGAFVVPTAGTLLANDPFILRTFAGVVDTSVQTWTQNNTATRFRALHGLDINPDTGNRLTVGRRNFRARNMGAVGPWYPAALCADRRYDLRAAMLTITPYEAAAGNYRAYYRAAPYKWAAPTDSDPMDAQLEPYDEWVVIRAAMKALKIEEGDTNPWREELELLRESITSSHQRDDEAAVIGDVEDDGSLLSGWNWLA